MIKNIFTKAGSSYKRLVSNVAEFGARGADNPKETKQTLEIVFHTVVAIRCIESAVGIVPRTIMSIWSEECKQDEQTSSAMEQ